MGEKQEEEKTVELVSMVTADGYREGEVAASRVERQGIGVRRRESRHK